ncbi:MAG: hypothetical protein M3N26_11870 [Pseudomonadota bacterium]|nr:hypothetical protein [Pseudomonadota bacterium]
MPSDTATATLGAGRSSRSIFGIYPIIVVFFAVWLAMSQVGLGGVGRPMFPAVAAVVAALLLRANRRSDYITFVLWLFMLTPFLRRVVDLHAGWSQVNLLMLAPYAAGLLCAWPVAKTLFARGFAYSLLFGVVFATVVYGVIVASIDDRWMSGSFDALRWLVPPIFGLFVAMDAERQLEYRATVVRAMLVALIVLSIYGVYQFIVAPPWDTFWMRESKLLSIGFPQPYQIRVFGTMNSPASLAVFLMAGLLWAIPARAAIRPIAIGAGVIGLLLTLVRTSWLGLVIGVVYLVVFGASARARLSIAIAIFCLPLVVLVIEQIPTGAEIINTRIASLSTVSNDTSVLDRSSEYVEFFENTLPRAPFGAGLGATGSYQAYLTANSATVLLDGAIMEIGVPLGVFAGGAYLLAVLTAAIIACWNSIRSGDTFLSSCGAIVASLSLSLLAGNIATGEAGIVFWLATCFCLAPAPRGLAGAAALR